MHLTDALLQSDTFYPLMLAPTHPKCDLIAFEKCLQSTYVHIKKVQRRLPRYFIRGKFNGSVSYPIIHAADDFRNEIGELLCCVLKTSR